jgi:hypothetical protein
MEFKPRLSNAFIMNIFMIILALLMALTCFFIKFPNRIFNHSYILWLFIAYIRLRKYGKYIYFLFTGKTLFIVNENYIYDGARKIKYYWDDIEEINVENAYLYLKLKNPNEYLNKIGWRSRSFIEELISNSYGTPFVINVDVVSVNLNALLVILDSYSINTI